MAIEEQGSLFYCMTPQLRTISKDWEGLYLKGPDSQYRKYILPTVLCILIGYFTVKKDVLYVPQGLKLSL